MLLLRRLAYSVGHLQNDLTAGVWFSYYLLYLQNVAGLSHSAAGYVIFIGQVVDAVTMPTAGVISDKSKGFPRYGKRKSWHLVGNLITSVTFPLLHLQCYPCAKLGLPYYGPIAAAFQVGWAFVQVSHLALIPEIADNNAEKVELNSYRYAWTVVANIIVYLTAWLLFGVSSTTEATVTPQDQSVFFTLSITMLGIGLVFNIMFHVGTKEDSCSRGSAGSTTMPHVNLSSDVTDVPTPNRAHQETSEDCQIDEGTDDLIGPRTEAEPISGVNDDVRMYGDTLPSTDAPTEAEKKKWYHWLMVPQFYQIALQYSCARIMVNVTQVYMPLYVIQSARLEKSYIAAIPLLTFLSGLVASMLTQYGSKCVGTKWVSFIGGVGVLVASVFFYFPGHHWTVICGSITLGSCSTVSTIAALALTTDLIGKRTENSAFIFGGIGFVDKIINGLIVVSLQLGYPKATDEATQALLLGNFFTWIMVLVQVVSASVYLFSLATIAKTDLASISNNKG